MSERVDQMSTIEIWRNWRRWPLQGRFAVIALMSGFAMIFLLSAPFQSYPDNVKVFGVTITDTWQTAAGVQPLLPHPELVTSVLFFLAVSTIAFPFFVARLLDHRATARRFVLIAALAICLAISYLGLCLTHARNIAWSATTGKPVGSPVYPRIEWGFFLFAAAVVVGIAAMFMTLGPEESGPIVS